MSQNIYGAATNTASPLDMDSGEYDEAALNLVTELIETSIDIISRSPRSLK